VSGDGDGGRPVIAVIGGGMAGLAAAWELSQHVGDGSGKDAEIVVLEAGGRPGGKVDATEFCGRTVDVAADAFLARRPEATRLCTELGLVENLVAPGTSGAALWTRGRLRMMPAGMNLGVPTRWWPLARAGILSPAGAVRAAADLFHPHRAEPGATGDRAVGEVVRDRLGHEVVERLVDPLVGGIHAGGVDDLSAETTFPALLTAERQSGSLMRRMRLPAPPTGDGSTPAPVFWSLEGSTARLPAELAAALATRGVAIRTGVAVERLERATGHGPGHRTWVLTLAGDTGAVTGAAGPSDSARTLEVDGMVLAVPAGQASGLLAGHAPRAAAILGDIQYSSVSVVTLSIPSAAIGSELVGTGFLVPRTSLVDGRSPLVTGCTYLTRKWPGLARPGDELIRLSLGRYGDDRPDSLDDDELTATAFGELTCILDIAGPPRASLVTRWDGAFPQYTPGHLERVEQVEQSVAELPGIGVAGSTYRGVGIPAVIGSGRHAARAVLRSLDGARRATTA
jgi:protoporphyrinogen/coproporphyrinogen III oxidase